ncbi:MAG TPA: TRAP transporter small permease [Burkholderiales bacterium]|nr:TRAP transporter small permease [Burkholderiales bacterium]
MTRFSAGLAKASLIASVAGLFAVVATVSLQVFGRYVLNDTPVWAESLTLVMMLYVSLVGAAVGVRDAGHIGMESLLVLVPERIRLRMEMVIHVLVAVFGAMMVWNGWGLTESVKAYNIPTLGISEGFKYFPLVVSGALISLFSVEHLIALIRGEEVVPAWH